MVPLTAIFRSNRSPCSNNALLYAKDNISGDFLVGRLARGMSTGKCCGPKIDNWPLQSALICRCLAVIACGGRGTTFVGGAFLDPVLVNWDKGDL